MGRAVLGVEAIADWEHGEYFLVFWELVVDAFSVHFEVIASVDVQFAGERVLQSMHFLISPRSTTPPNLLQVAIIILLNVLKAIQNFLHFLLHRPHSRILLRPTIIIPIIPDNNSNSILLPVLVLYFSFSFLRLFLGHFFFFLFSDLLL